MQIHGREIGFRRTVLGNCEIAEICPNRDINKFNDLVNGDYITTQKAAASFMVALSKGYEMNRAFEEPGYQPRPLTVEELMLLDNEIFNELFVIAISRFADDGKTTVEAEPIPVKKTENTDDKQDKKSSSI